MAVTDEAWTAPLVRTAERLGALDAYAGFATGVVDGVDGWVGLDKLDDHLDTWIDGMTAHHGDRRLAVSLHAAAVSWAVIHPAIGALLLDGRVPDPGLGNLAVRPDADGHLERCGIRGPWWAGLTADGPAVRGTGGTAFPDEGALIDWWAPAMVASVSSLFDVIASRHRLNRRAAWGAVGDGITGAAVWIAGLTGADAGVTWRRARDWVARVQQHAPVDLPAARLCRVPRDGAPDEVMQVRGTCCLYYRSSRTSGPRESRYCTTCPLLADPARARRIRDAVVG